MIPLPRLHLQRALTSPAGRPALWGVGVIVAHGCWLLAGTPGNVSAPWIDDLSWAFSATVMLLLCWRVSRHERAPAGLRRSWRLSVMAVVVLVGTNLNWAFADFAGRDEWYAPIGVAGLLYLPLLIVAMLSIPGEAATKHRAWRRRAFDGTIIALAGALLLWILVVDSVTVPPDAPLPNKIVAYGYPMGGLLTLYVIVDTWLRRPIAVARGGLAMVTLALGATFLGDLGSSLQAIETITGAPAWIWLLGTTFGIMAPVVQLDALQHAPPVSTNRGYPTPPSTTPYTLAAFVAAVLLIRTTDFTLASESVAVFAAVGVMLLVVLRQWIAHREHGEALAHQARLDARFAALVEGSSDVIAVVGTDGTLSYVSPSIQRILGYDPDSLIGSPLAPFFHDDEVEAFNDLYRTVLSRTDNSVTPASSWRVRAADGSWRIMQATATNRLDDPAVHGVILNGRDITDQRRLEDQLHQARQMEAIGRFASVIAHDFNHVLSAIRLNVELQGPESYGDAPTAEILNTLDLGAGLTRQLLAVSQQRVSASVVLDLAAVVRQSDRILRPLLTSGVRLVLDAGTTPVRVRADEAQLRQVLLNLVVNARDATPQGTISVRVRTRELDGDAARALVGLKPGPHASLVVQDTGTGMTPAMLERLFEPYYTTKAGTRGSGLGLTIVYGIVMNAGGHIRAESRPGAGSCFEILLPLAEADTDEHPADPVGRPERRTHVLIVDDDPAIRFALQRSFTLRGYDVSVAGDGEEALTILRRPGTEIHVVLTDIRMPRLDGPGLIAAMETDWPDLPVLAFSGFLHADDHARVGSRVSAFIEKPFTLDEVHRAVERALG